LLLLYEQLGVTALVISLREDALIVRCQCADDVPALKSGLLGCRSPDALAHLLPEERQFDNYVIEQPCL
jgi:hypothetical protein